MKIFFTLLLLTAFSVYNNAAYSQSDYRSVSSGNWSNIAIWETFNGTSWVAAASAPTSADGVITIQNGNNVLIDAPVTADQIVVATGGTLSVNSFVSTSGGNDLTLNNGSGTDLVVNGTLALGGFNFINGPGDIQINGTMNWTSGTLAATTVSTIGSTINLSNDFVKNLAADLTNNGTFNWATGASAGGIAFTNATFTNNGTINENFSSDRGLINNGGTNAFINNGSFIKTTTFGFFNNTVPFTNTGKLQGIGSFNLTGTVSNTGGIYPGNGIGILSITPAAVTGNPAQIWIQVQDGSGPGTGNDRLDFTGVTDITGATLGLTENTSSPLQSYTIMTAPGPNGFVGTFANLVIPGGWTITIDNTTNPSTVIATKIVSTLPVVWGSFNALSENNHVRLSWTTLEESNTSEFSIEYSADGQHYSSLGTVPAKGNSASKNEYSFIHQTPNLQSSNYYRIKQVDKDSKVSYSAIRLVRFNKGVLQLLQVVNPTRGNLQLTSQAENINIDLVGNDGRILKKIFLTPGTNQVNIQDLPNGIYHLIIYQKQVKIDDRQILKY